MVLDSILIYSNLADGWSWIQFLSILIHLMVGPGSLLVFSTPIQCMGDPGFNYFISAPIQLMDGPGFLLVISAPI